MTHVAHWRDLRIGDRLTELVDDSPGDDPAARQREVHLLERLTIRDFERLAGFEWTDLAEGQRDEAALAGVERVATCGQLFELVASFGVRAGDTSFADVGRRSADERLAQRLAGIGGDDTAADDRSAGL